MWEINGINSTCDGNFGNFVGQPAREDAIHSCHSVGSLAPLVTVGWIVLGSENSLSYTRIIIALLLDCGNTNSKHGAYTVDFVDFVRFVDL